MTTVLLLIDPQVDFHEQITNNNFGSEFTNYSPSLPIPNSGKDAELQAKFINEHNGELSKVYVSFDTHSEHDISHNVYWVDKNGNEVSPGTNITLNSILDGSYSTKNPNELQHAKWYIENLEKNNGSHYVFPVHCVKGTIGHMIHPAIDEAIKSWEKSNKKARISFEKGMNPNYEFFGAFKSEVVDENIPETQLNTSLLKEILDCEKLYITGEALSHCVSTSLAQIIEYIDECEDLAEKELKLKSIILLSNMSSAVPGFESQTHEFLERFKEKGIEVHAS